MKVVYSLKQNLNGGAVLSNARIFLDLYNNLEELLKAKYANSNDKRFSNVIMRYTNEDEGRKWREELDLCREIRNMLSHHARFEGEDIFQPSDAIIAFLREVTDAVEHPPAAMTLCTPTDRLLTCRENDRAVDVIRKMNGAGYSHVPIVSEGKLCGVFSAGVIFSYIEANGSGAVTDRTVLSDFGAFLAADAHKTETYRVVGPGESYEGIKKVFVPSGPGKLRVAAVFVTRGGEKDGKLLGMITPWDMLRCGG